MAEYFCQYFHLQKDMLCTSMRNSGGGGGALVCVVSGGISSGNVLEQLLRWHFQWQSIKRFLKGALLFVIGLLCYFYFHTDGILGGRVLSVSGSINASDNNKRQSLIVLCGHKEGCTIVPIAF